MIWIVDDDLEFSGLVKQQVLKLFELCHKRVTGTFDGVEDSDNSKSLNTCCFEDSDSLKKLITCCSEDSDKIQIRLFANAIEAISQEEVPELIFLDILLDGPDGFTFLNEMRSYEDLSRVPVVIMSSLNFAGRDLSAYGVVGYLNKSEMTPADVAGYVERYCGLAQNKSDSLAQDKSDSLAQSEEGR